MLNGFKLLSALQQFRIKLFNCPACGISVLVKFGSSETRIRCIRCRGSVIHLSLISTITEIVKNPETATAYEPSSRGAVVRFLKQHVSKLDTSEFYESVKPGSICNGTRCEDIQNLTYTSSSFDLVTSTEVFEHVADDLAGFKEIKRVLKDAGHFIFTVPLSDTNKTNERACLVGANIKHILPAQYHSDKISGHNSVLVFRDYGTDITERLLAAGFSAAWIKAPLKSYFGFSRNVIVAKV